MYCSVPCYWMIRQCKLNPRCYNIFGSMWYSWYHWVAYIWKFMSLPSCGRVLEAIWMHSPEIASFLMEYLFEKIMLIINERITHGASPGYNLIGLFDVFGLFCVALKLIWIVTYLCYLCHSVIVLQISVDNSMTK